MFNFFINYLFTHTPLLYLIQSLWRDEAFSVLIAEPGGLETIRVTAADFNPPLYYLLLHYWIKIFGKNEISIRMLSFVFFLCFLYIFYKFALAVFNKKWAIILTIIASVCPMLVYYGFEARMYSLYALTTTASMYFFYTKKWKSYIVATTLALYTHPFTIFVPLTQGLYLLLKKKLTKKTFINLAIPFIFYLPWIIVIINQLKNSNQMWIYPVNLNLIKAVMANLLTGYEGTPGFLWKYMQLFSLLIFILYAFAFSKKENRDKYLLFFLWVFVPLSIVLAISYFKPIFVNRYVITVTVAQLFLLIISIRSLPLRILKTFSLVALISVFTYLLFFLPPFIKKVNIRDTFLEVNSVLRQDDLVIARTPLVFFESLYYSPDRSRVFLYNPDMITLPAYLGNVLIPVNKHIASFPTYPKRAFMVYENGSYELFSGFPK